MMGKTDKKRRPALLSLAIMFGLLLGLGAGARASPPVLDAPFVIDPGPGGRANPAVAYNPLRQQFLVAYELGTGWFSMALLDHVGKLVWDPPFVNIAYGERPALAYNDALDQYLLVWQEYDAANLVYQIKGLYLDADGYSAIGSSFAISTSGWDHQQPAVAFNTHGTYKDYLVVWQESRFTLVPWPRASSAETTLQSWWEIWGRPVAGSSGGGLGGTNFNGADFAIADNSATTTWSYTQPDVAYNLNMNEYLVVYTREPVGGGAKDVWSRRVTRDGDLLTEQAIDDGLNDQLDPSVAAYRLNQGMPYLVAYTDYELDPAGDVRAVLVDQQGQWQSRVHLAVAYGRQERDPDVASSEALGGYTVVWSQTENDWDIYGRRVRNDGSMEEPFNLSVYGLPVVPCHEETPVVAAGAPVGLAVWQDSCLGGGGPYKIAGRLLGYRAYLPLVVRNVR
jgi:hypothetical protein